MVQGEVIASSLSEALSNLSLGDQLKMQKRIVEEQGRKKRVDTGPATPQPVTTNTAEAFKPTENNVPGPTPEQIARFKNALARSREIEARIKELETELKQSKEKSLAEVSPATADLVQLLGEDNVRASMNAVEEKSTPKTEGEKAPEKKEDKKIDKSPEVKKDIEELNAQQILNEVDKIIKGDFAKKLEENKLAYTGVDIFPTKLGLHIEANFKGNLLRGKPKFVADIINDNGNLRAINHKLEANPLVSALAPKEMIDNVANNIGENMKKYIEKDRKKEIERLDIEDGLLKITYKS